MQETKQNKTETRNRLGSESTPEPSDTVVLTRNRLFSDSELKLAPPLTQFRAKSVKPVYRNIQVPNLISKMVLTDLEIQTMVERRVPIFYGQQDVDMSEVHYFIDACERINQKEDFKNKDQAETLLEEIKLRLRGRAYTIVRDSQVKSLNDLYRILTKKFLPSHSIESLSNRLYSAKQNQSEDCSEFGARVQGYALDYEAGVRAKFGEGNVLPKPFLNTLEQDAFIRGLKNETIRAHLTMVSDTPTRDLIEMADRLERQLGYSQRYNETRTDTRETRCQLCGRLGHEARECPVNIPHQKQKEQYPPSKFCRYCRKRGHLIAECVTKRANDARREQFVAQPRVPTIQFPHSGMTNNQQNFKSRQPNDYYTRTNQFDYTNQQGGNQPSYPVQRTNHNSNPSQRDNQTFNYRQPRNFAKGNQTIDQISNGLANLKINYIEDENVIETHTQGNELGLADL